MIDPSEFPQSGQPLDSLLMESAAVLPGMTHFFGNKPLAPHNFFENAAHEQLPLFRQCAVDLGSDTSVDVITDGGWHELDAAPLVGHFDEDKLGSVPPGLLDMSLRRVGGIIVRDQVTHEYQVFAGEGETDRVVILQSDARPPLYFRQETPREWHEILTPRLQERLPSEDPLDVEAHALAMGVFIPHFTPYDLIRRSHVTQLVDVLQCAAIAECDCSM